MKFTEFNLHTDLLTGIAASGYETCTPVQEQVLKTALEGADLYVQSQTGTGKTAAFLIALIQQMLSRTDAAGRRALIMVPTRELAVQVEEEAERLCSGASLKTGSFYGGVGYTRQTDLLKEGIDILIGTPGRVIDLQESGAMDLSTVGFLVIDEADRMFDMGFYPDLRKLIKVLPGSASRQTMLFSATLNTYVKNLAWEYTNEAHEISIEPEQVTVEEIDQLLFHVSSDCKMRLLTGIIRKENPESLIIFCNTKRSCEVVARRLVLNGIEAEFIIGDLPQSKRLQVLESFKRGSLRCLVATDVAARGIDVNGLAMVINYDLPNESENYVHRIGRTARAGKTGKAYTFCSEQDVYNLPGIERYIGMAVPSTMASDELFGEDASAGVYIELGNYRDDGPGRKKSERTGGLRRKKSGKQKSQPREQKSQPRAQKAPPRGGSREEEKGKFEELAALPLEERMRHYRKKFGEGTGEKREGPGTARAKKEAPSRGRSSPKRDEERRAGDADQQRKLSRKKTAEHSGSAQKRRSAPAPRTAAAEKIPAPKAAERAPEPPKKKGLFDRLKSFLGIK